MVLDTLVYTISFLFIPINIAAVRAKYVLMNLYIGLLATSWATHSIWHVKDKPCTTIYCSLDEVVCNTTIAFTFFYGMLYVPFIQFFIYCASLCSVVYWYFKLKGNPNYHKRGLENWRHHTNHILMHASAVIGLSAVAF